MLRPLRRQLFLRGKENDLAGFGGADLDRFEAGQKFIDDAALGLRSKGRGDHIAFDLVILPVHLQYFFQCLGSKHGSLLMPSKNINKR